MRPDDGDVRVVFDVARTAEVPGEGRHARARRPLRPFFYAPVRIAFDVSPLSHPRTGIGNYVRGSLAGLAEAAAGRHELIAFAPTRLRGRRLIHEALDGVPVDVRTVVLPWSHAFRMGWSRLGRPAVERLLGRLDVLHFSDWMVPPQRGGIRSTMVHDLVPLRFPSGSPRARARCTATSTRAPRECDLVFVNSAYTGRDVEEHLSVPGERIRVAPPGVAGEYTADGERGRARPAVRAQPRHARAAQEPRHAGRGLAAAARTSSRSPSRAPPAGATSRCSTTPAILKLGFVAATARCRG